MTFIPVLLHKRRVFETEIIFLSGLGAEIAILVFASCWSTVGGGGGKLFEFVEIQFSSSSIRGKLYAIWRYCNF